jgi:hypothetical protein
MTTSALYNLNLFRWKDAVCCNEVRAKSNEYYEFPSSLSVRTPHTPLTEHSTETQLIVTRKFIFTMESSRRTIVILRDKKKPTALRQSNSTPRVGVNSAKYTPWPGEICPATYSLPPEKHAQTRRALLPDRARTLKTAPQQASAKFLRHPAHAYKTHLYITSTWIVPCHCPSIHPVITATVRTAEQPIRTRPSNIYSTSRCFAQYPRFRQLLTLTAPY